MRRWMFLVAALLPLTGSEASDICTQSIVAPAHQRGIVDVTMGGGMAYNRDGTAVVVAPGSSPPYAVTRYSVPSHFTSGDRLLLPSGAPFPARYIAASEDLETLLIEANDVPAADPGDDNGHRDLYVARWDGPSFKRITVTPTGGDSNGDTESGYISADGTRALFVSYATNLAPNAPARGAYLWDEASDGLTLVRHADGQPLTCTGHSAMVPRHFKRDGSLALISCWGSFNGPELFEVDTTTSLASPIPLPPSKPFYLAANDDLTRMLFEDFVDGSGHRQYVLWDRQAARWDVVSARQDGTIPASSPNNFSIDGEGRFVAFLTRGPDIIGADNGNFIRTYVRDMQTGELSVVNGDGYGVPRADVFATLSREGDRMLVRSTWPRLSRLHDESSHGAFSVGNPLRCDPVFWGDGYEP